jgi:DnaK suppressor protein
MPATKSSKNKSASTKAAASGSAAARKKAAAKPASAARKTAVKKAPAVKKPAAKKAPAKSKPAAKKTPASKAAAKPGAKKAVVTKPVAKKPVAKKAPVKKAASKPAARKAAPAPKKVLPAKKPLAINPDQPEPSFGFSGPLKGFKPYQPTPREEYMSDKMREHFRDVLTAWKQELMEEVDRTVHHMKDEAANFPDPNDRATQESEFGLELRTRDRERKLLKKIEQALARIEDGTYGYCSETGEEIGLRRLEARPVATLTVEAQERRELAEKQYRDRDDR